MKDQLPSGSVQLSEYQLSDVPVGGLVPYAGDLRGAQLEALGWMVADGREVQIQLYPELYAALGTTFGSSGAGTFRLPKVPPMKLVNADDDAFDAAYLIRVFSQRHHGFADADA